MLTDSWVRTNSEGAAEYAAADPVGAPVRTTPTIIIVGAGASGALCAAHLAREASAARRRVDIVLVDPGLSGRGIAYATTDPRHLLNAPARATYARVGFRPVGTYASVLF